MDELYSALKLILDNLRYLSDYELTYLSGAIDDEIAFRSTLIALGLVKEDADR